MNNPESNFMSPIRTQPMKKQRAGSTPARSLASGRSHATSTSRTVGPPPTATATAPAMGTYTTSTATGSSMNDADDAIARRRAELRRLKEQRQRQTIRAAGPPPSGSRPPVTSTSDLLRRQAPTGPPRTAMPVGSTAPPPGELERVRHSDIFPSVTKPPPALLVNTSTATTASATVATATASTGPPPKPPMTKATPPPPVARRLQFPASANRAKSAPPRRPPPPPPSAPTTTTPGSSKEAPSRVQRTADTMASARPAPVSPSTLLSPPVTNKTTSTGPPPKPQVQLQVPALAKKDPKVFAKTPIPSRKEQPPTEESSSSSVLDTSAPPIAPAKTPMPMALSSPAHSPPQQPPSTARRDRMRQMLEHVDSPPQPSKTTTTDVVPEEASQQPPPKVNLQNKAKERLEAAYETAQEETRKALERVQELETKLAEHIAKTPLEPKAEDSDPVSLQQMLQIAERDGEQAALQWAKQQVSGVPPLTTEPPIVMGFAPTPMVPASPAARLLLGAIADAGRPRIQRTATPFPKHAAVTDETPPIQLERQFQKHFREAAESLPFEYTSNTATFTIRRPYGMETVPQLFEYASTTDHQTYSRKAHVSTASSLEVAATIAADNSVLILFDTAGVRYKTNPHARDFVTVPNVDESDRPLGTVPYIDSEANEQDYSLDEVLEEALLVREHYASTLTSTALSWKDRPAAAETVAPPPVMEKPKTSEIAVDTSDIPYPPPASSDAPKDPSTKGASKPKKAEPESSSSDNKAPMSEPDSGSGDVLAVFLGMVVQSFFGCIWWILVTLPLATVKASLIGMGGLALLGTFYVFALQDYNANMAMVAHTYLTNAPGIV